jgi:capsular polysaccharide biosynthesis protein
MRLKDLRVIDGFYCDENLENFYIKSILTKNFFYLRFTLNFFLVRNLIFFFFKKKKVYPKKNSIFLLGPHSYNYSHQIHEFITRLLFLKKLNFKHVYVPLYLKKKLQSLYYKKIFSKMNFAYYPNNINCIFYNINYITHPYHRWNRSNKNKKVGTQFKFLLNKLRKEVNNFNIVSKSCYSEYILVSREKCNSRKLLNEEELFMTLRNYNFQKVYFENTSIDDQITIAKKCKIMIGYHGAGLTNLIFMKNQKLIIEIKNKFYDHFHIELFAKAQNLNYKNFYCILSKKNLDGVCDVKIIEDYIRKFI